MESLASLELAALVGRRRRTNEVAFASQAREAARHRGVCWSAMSPPPPQPRSSDHLLSEAQAELCRRQDWRAAPVGGFVAAIARAQQLAEAAHAAGERGRAAASRSFEAELDQCAAAAEELAACARDLVRSARQARRAVKSAREA